MSESIGQRLKQEREARYLTLEKASDDTRIRVIFLQALESDDYSAMPSAAQGRGFLRNYAEYLDLNIDEMIAEIQKNAPVPAEVSGPLPQVNLVETEIPPLTNSQDDKTARPFWTSWFGRGPKAESAPEAESTEPAQAEVTELKAEAETLPVEAEQAEVKDEAKPSLISKLSSFIQFRKKKELDIVPEIEEESAPAIEQEIKQEAPSLPADVIFAEIGAQLRARRELISLTFEEVERHTHLRAVFVKALEEGAFDKLPSPVQTRGMLINYAAFLDLDADTIMLRFADALQARHREKYAETPREKIQTEVVTSMPLLRTFIAGDLIFGVVMIAILLALAIWGVGSVVSLQGDQSQIAQPTAPSIVDVLGNEPLPTASLAATFVAAEDNPLGTAPAVDAFTTPDAPTPGTDANVIVNVFAVERTFVRISVDGELIFEGRMAPGETKVFEAENQVVVLTGNAAALRITYNGRDLGLMGGVGEVVSRVYLVSGVATPTATIPPTPTNTLPVTSTSTPTKTPTATPTVTPPDGG